MGTIGMVGMGLIRPIVMVMGWGRMLMGMGMRIIDPMRMLMGMRTIDGVRMLLMLCLNSHLSPYTTATILTH
jgi:hypothetical protein